MGNEPPPYLEPPQEILLIVTHPVGTAAAGGFVANQSQGSFNNGYVPRPSSVTSNFENGSCLLSNYLLFLSEMTAKNTEPQKDWGHVVVFTAHKVVWM